MEERKVALVTGGARGIGKAIALKFAKNNYNIVLNYVSDNTDTQSLKDELEQYGIEAICVKADVSKKDEVEEMVKQAIEKFGKIDVLVNNAGVTKDCLLMRMKEEDFDKVININLKGTFLMTKEVIPYINSELSFENGIYVAQISANGPSYKTELKEGDIIISIDGTELNTMNDLREYIYGKKPGENVTLKISRGKITKEITITLGKR